MKLFCFVGASGSGKSTIQHSLPMSFMTHYTTREPRSGEIDGLHVKHVTMIEFIKLFFSSKVATVTKYAGNLYGSPVEAIEEIKAGNPFHATATKESVEQFKKLLGNDKVVVIAVLPPDVGELRARMEQRGDSLEEIERRIKNIEKEKELDYSDIADYIVVNNDLNMAIEDVKDIINRELKT